MSEGNAADPTGPDQDGEVAGKPELSELDAPAKQGSLRVRAFVLGGVVIALAAVGGFAWKQVKPVVESRKYASVEDKVPEAPKLTAADGETIYRIDPTRSSLSYEVAETFVGKETSTATGLTRAIAGDFALDPTDLSGARAGTIVADIEQLRSDNNLRDARLRLDYLESHANPLATLEATEIEGLSGELVEGEDYPFTMTGDLTVKGITAPVTFDATASVDDGTLTATATAATKLSTYEAGPIRIAGMLATSDEATLTLEITALDPATNTIPTTLDVADDEAAADAPSFAATVQPILEANCVSCHNTGKMGAHAITIDTAGDAEAISDGLKTVTETRHMPPWPASDEGVPLKHQMALTQAEIDAIAEWADAGGVLDVDPDLALDPTAEAAGPVPRQDLVLERPDYLGSNENTNDYRCFVLDPEFTEPTYLTGYTFLGDQMEELHHAQVFHISGEQVESSKAVDGVDGQPGWSCYSGPELEGRRPSKVPGRGPILDAGFSGQANLVAGWVPGQGPSTFPLESGILMEPGDALVLQLHYHFSGEPTPDHSSLSLQLEPGTADIKALRVINPIGPVEIPCAPEDHDEPLCDRDAALADNVQLYGPSGAGNEAGLLQLCGKTAEELAATFDGSVASSSCDHVIPEDGTLVAVLGHMHTLGKSITLTLDADTDDEQVLLDIPEWSFDWQMNYELATPIKVKRGQPLLLECSWDRRVDPLRDPKYIVFAEGTEDEMCFATYALIPDNQG